MAESWHKIQLHECTTTNYNPLLKAHMIKEKETAATQEACSPLLCQERQST